MSGIMRRISVGALAVVLASCASPLGSNTPNRWSQPVVTWKGSEATTLPMDTVILDGRLVFFTVELSINGESESFLVDSGSSSTSFTDNFLRTLSPVLSAGQEGVIYGLGWSKKANTIMVDSIDLGFARINRLEIPNKDILGMMFNQQLTSKGGRPLAGIIGVDLLAPLGASIDLAKSTITFRKMPGQPREPASASAAPAAGRPAGHP